MNLEVFERGFRKRKLSSRIAGVIILLVSVAAIFWGLTDHTDSAMARMVALSFVGIPVSVAVFVSSFFPPQGLAAVRTPETIVWFYGIGGGGNIHTIVLGLETGKLRRLPLPHCRDAAEATTTLRQLAPSAAQGYSEELRRQFKRDPQSMRSWS